MKKFVILLGAALVGVYGAEAASVRPDYIPPVLKGASHAVLKAYHAHADDVAKATTGKFADGDYIPPPYMPAPAVVLEVYRAHAAEGERQRAALEYLDKYGLDVEKDIAYVMLIAFDAFNSLALGQVGYLEHLVKHGNEQQKAFAESALLTFYSNALAKDPDAAGKEDFQAYLQVHGTLENKEKLRDRLLLVAREWPWISKTRPMQELGIELMAIDC